MAQVEKLKPRNQIRKILGSVALLSSTFYSTGFPHPSETVSASQTTTTSYDSRIGVSVSEQSMIEGTDKLHINTLRIGSPTSLVSVDGTFENNPQVEEELTEADKENKKVIFCYDPGELPFYTFVDNGAVLRFIHSMPKTVSELKQNETQIKEFIKLDLLAITEHKSVEWLEIGNEPNESNFWWDQNYDTFAYFTKETLAVLKSLHLSRPVTPILAAISGPSIHYQQFGQYITALLNQSIQIQNVDMAVHAYNRADLQAGVSQVDEVGGIPIVTEVNTDNKKDTLTSQVKLAELITTLPVTIYQLKSRKDSPFAITQIGEQYNELVKLADESEKRS